MSSNNEQTKNLEEEVVVNEMETTELVELDKEAKKAEMVRIAKKVLKIAGIATIGIVGFYLGTKASGTSDYDASEMIEDVIKDVE